MKKIKIFLTALSASLLATAGSLAVSASQPYVDAINVSLEAQESASSDKIRYISTMTPVMDLDSITKIDINLTLSKNGVTKEKTITTYTVYDEVTGTNGKSKIDNNYYAVFTVTDLHDFAGWTLGATFEYFYIDSTSEETNTIDYTIPYGVTLDTGSGTFGESSSLEDCFTASSIDGGNIFHAWNWSMTTIEENLDDIYAAGYTTIQTSPMQPQKDYYEGNAQSDWWKFYQPLGFCVAKDGVNNALGTKSQLVSMVSAAHEKGMKVIVDVVANHLAGSYNKLADGVATYEPKIYGNNGTRDGGALLHSAGASGIEATDSGHTTDGHIYLPDLDTGNETVQQRVLSLLKEYIDCGVDGFRFDAAKHIETDNNAEPNGASQFWPIVLNGADSYAQEKGRAKPYYYGEILFGCGNGRSYSWYTKYMDVIDNTTGNNITSTFNGNTPTSSSAYNTGCSADQVVVWGESHDTYSNESHESTFINQAVVDKSYAYSAARGGAQSLYFARPCADNQFGYIGSDNKLKITCPVLLGKKGDWNAFKSAQITAVNKFHNYWGNASEFIDSNGSFSEIVRYNDNESGMVLINASSGTSVSNIAVPDKMKNGIYTDLVTGSTFTVSNGKVSGTMDSCGIAVLYSNTNSGTVSIADDIEDFFYTQTATATYTITNAVSATLEVNGKTYDITSGAKLTFGNYIKEMESITVTIKAMNSNNIETSKTFVYTRVPAPTIYTVTLTKPEGWGDTIYAFMFGSDEANATWPGIVMDSEDDVYSITYTSIDEYDYIIFSDGTYQSEDLELDHTNASYHSEAVTTSHFANSVNWGNVNAYIWNDSTSNQVSAWPGTQIFKDASGLYAVAYNSSYDHIIFNNGTVQTSDLPFNEYISKYDFDGSSAKLYYNIVKNTCASHTWDDGVITKEPTCEETGIKTYTCTNCVATYTEVIPALGHDYDYTQEPTWVWNGFDSAVAKFTCKHDASHKISIDATITSNTVEGVTTYTATVTVEGHTYTTTKVNDGSHTHTYTHVAAKAATCEETGNYEYYYCEECNTYFDASYNETTLEALTIAKTSHTVTPGVYSKASGVTCSICGEEVTINVDSDTIYYVNVNDWANVYAYAWKNPGGDGNQNNAWPGVLMTKTDYTYNGHDIYSYSVKDTDYTMIIFTNNSGNQTADLPIPSDANCYYNGSFDYVFVK